MKNLIRCFVFVLALCSFTSASYASELRNLSWTELQSEMRKQPKQDVLIEFYSSKPDGLNCDRCKEQESVLAELAGKYGADIGFVRIDVATAPFLVDIGLVGIYPTHLFVRHDVPVGQEIVAKRIRGFLSAADFQQLIKEFFEKAPGTN